MPLTGPDPRGADAPANDADRYGVVGNPIAHSLSPEIHAAFARQTGEAVDYRRILAPLEAFDDTVERFFADGGRGLNVTVPFKLDAFALCGSRVSGRAARAGAVNFLGRDADGIVGDNTDGVGLVRDLRRLLDAAGDRLADARVLLVGAGGAARGVIGPLLEARLRSLVIVNRDASKATALVDAFVPSRGGVAIESRSFDELVGEPFDVVVNATSASLSGEALPLPPSTLVGARLVYDMMYAATPTPFLVDAEHAGATATCDGLGMLVEQAAESFALWRGVRPHTAPVLASLRALLRAKAPR